jgi:diguanylate cyclase (GGDEF)-like protein
MRPCLSPRRSGAAARRWPAVAALALLLAPAASPPAGAAGRPGERGFPLIQGYAPPVEGAESQSYAIAHDPRGFLYVGNHGGLLIYDGARWQLVPIGRKQSAFSVACDAAGRVAVGGIDDLGYLDADAGGTPRFVSLAHLLPPAARQTGQVLQIVPAAGGFIFNVADRLLLWDGAALSTLAAYPPVRPYPEIFEVAGSTYVWSQAAGLSRLAGRRLAPVPGGESFRGRRVDALVPDGDGLLASVRGEGLFRLAAGRATPFAPEASRWAAAHRLLGGTRLAGGRWAFASVLGGLLLLLPDGRIEQVIDTAVGLPDDFVSGMAVDREGALWLALNKGLAKVEVASPLSVVDHRSGLKGNTYVVARYRDSLWAGTEAGLFTAAGAAPAAGSRDWDQPVRMRQLPGVPPGVWSLAAADEDLLVGEAFGIHVLRAGGPPRALPGTPQDTVYALARSRRQPERVWVGMEKGFAALRRDRAAPEGWRFEGMIDPSLREVRSIVEGDDGRVWCGSSFTGIVGMEIPAGSLRPVGVRQVAGSGDSELVRTARGILVAQENRVLRLDERRARLVAEPGMGLGPVRGGPGSFSTIGVDAAGNLWLGTNPPTVALRRSPGRAPELRSLVEVPARETDQFLAEPDGVVWMVTDSGLYRYAGPPGGEPPPLPRTHLARITVGGGGVYFGGAPGHSPRGGRAAELPPDVRRLRIELAPLSFRAGLRYQTRLEPIDRDWGAPTAESYAELTQLPPGAYTFQARTVGPSGEVSPQAAWSFRVRPPWYQAPWALALAIAAALGGVRGYAGLRGRALRQRAARLEARVAEQTVELRHHLAELRRAQGDLEAANARLEALSLQDELTGIANRRRFQQVLADEWARARRQQLPLALVILDLDHFKLLNDTQGHLEGDLRLQAVAAYLAQAIRRTGDLVARYGGEELAILLPATGLDAALRLAEQLRLGIETLALPHAATPRGRITASCGVAALVPEHDQAADRLVEAADDALYRAKTAGRNRVWPAPPETAAGEGAPGGTAAGEGARGENAPGGTAHG